MIPTKNIVMVGKTGLTLSIPITKHCEPVEKLNREYSSGYAHMITTNALAECSSLREELYIPVVKSFHEAFQSEYRAKRESEPELKLETNAPAEAAAGWKFSLTLPTLVGQNIAEYYDNDSAYNTVFKNTKRINNLSEIMNNFHKQQYNFIRFNNKSLESQAAMIQMLNGSVMQQDDVFHLIPKISKVMVRSLGLIQRDSDILKDIASKVCSERL